MINKNTFDESVFIAEGAQVIKDVSLGKDCSVWFNAVIRADNHPIVIGDCSNVQDNAVLHADINYPLTIGKYVTIGHGAIVHGCTVNDYCIIGMGAIVMNGAVIGKNCIIGAGTLVTEGTVIPDNSIVVGVPGKIIRQVSKEDIEKIEKNATHYVALSKKYL